MANAKLVEPTKVEQRQVRHLVFDFSQDAHVESNAFQKCIALGVGVSSCVDLDPETLKGSISVEFSGVTLAKSQVEVGAPVSIDFDANPLGKGSLTAAIIDNENGQHSVQEHLIITGPFGIKVLEQTVTVRFPF